MVHLSERSRDLDRQVRLLKPEVIGAPDCPLFHRWTFGTDRLMRNMPVKFLLHHFLANADDRDVHDHPRPFITFVLQGGYDDMKPCETCMGVGSWPQRNGAAAQCPTCGGEGVELNERMRAGMVRCRPARHRHRTKVHRDGCWTFVIMGPIERDWGFWRSGRFYKFRDYEHQFGFGMRCD